MVRQVRIHDSAHNPPSDVHLDSPFAEARHGACPDLTELNLIEGFLVLGSGLGSGWGVREIGVVDKNRIH